MSVCSHPCPCGYYGEPEREVQANSVRSSLGMVQRYQKRISGPLTQENARVTDLLGLDTTSKVLRT